MSESRWDGKVSEHRQGAHMRRLRPTDRGESSKHIRRTRRSFARTLAKLAGWAYALVAEGVGRLSELFGRVESLGPVTFTPPINWAEEERKSRQADEDAKKTAAETKKIQAETRKIEAETREIEKRNQRNVSLPEAEPRAGQRRVAGSKELEVLQEQVARSGDESVAFRRHALQVLLWERGLSLTPEATEEARGRVLSELKHVVELIHLAGGECQLIEVGSEFEEEVEYEEGNGKPRESETGGEERHSDVHVEERIHPRDEANRKPGALRTIDVGDGVTMNFCWIPAGKFTMGSPDSELGREGHEGPQREVTISRGFWFGQTPVTQAQWKKVMGTDPSGYKGADRPVESVSWDDCAAFLGKLSFYQGETFRLPTEAEWEYACRAGTKTPWFFGNAASALAEYAWFEDNAGSETKPVGKKEPNPWGLLDICGNVWEWCADWKGAYPPGSATDPTGPSSGSDRVLRGGSWRNHVQHCRSASRGSSASTKGYTGVGFRVLLPVQ